MAANSTTTKPIHSLVLDAGPIIKNEPTVSSLINQAECLYTVPAVVNEIRDVTARERVQTTLLPFLTLRSPQPASIKIITDFARKTGDLEVLSKPDIQIMALAYELECERNHGDWRLRSTPGQKRLNGAPPASLTGRAPADGEVGEPKTQTETTDVSEPADAQESAETKPTEAQESVDAKPTVPEFTEATATETSPQAETSSDEPPAELLERTHITDGAEQPLHEMAAEEVEAEDSEGSDGEGWITPSNVKKHKAKDDNGLSKLKDEPKTMQVATLTSDFAMQNVLLRMNLNLLSTSLHSIRQLKTWVLRCHGCFYISKDMEKQFCPRCGKPTLMRTSCSTDQNGNFRVHLKKNMQWNTRGNVYSIPKPTAGTTTGRNILGGGKGAWGHNLILAEDQKEYTRAVSTAKRQKEKDLMDEDYLPNILSGDRNFGGGKPKVGAGRNVNGRRRR